MAGSVVKVFNLVLLQESDMNTLLMSTHEGEIGSYVQVGDMKDFLFQEFH